MCTQSPPQRLLLRCISPVQWGSLIREMALSDTEVLSMCLGNISYSLFFLGSTKKHAALSHFWKAFRWDELMLYLVLIFWAVRSEYSIAPTDIESLSEVLPVMQGSGLRMERIRTIRLPLPSATKFLKWKKAKCTWSNRWSALCEHMPVCPAGSRRDYSYGGCFAD